MTRETRNRIILFSFVLTVFVIWLHAGEPLISSIPGQIAVPGFFILSGFLFFAGIPAMEVRTGGLLPGWIKELFPGWLLKKQGRRVRTLLIPYLCWNLFYFLLYLLFGKAQTGEWAQAVFLYRYNPVFWYLWQLILLSLITPLIYLVMNKKGCALCWLVFAFLLAVFYLPVRNALGFHLINGDALFYYSLGAYASLHIYKRGMECSRKQKALHLAAALLLLLISEVLFGILPAELLNAATVGICASGAMVLWFFLCLLPAGWIRIVPWMRLSFLIYATHYLVIRLVWAVETALGLNENLTANVITYLLMPVFCVAAAYGLYLIMKKLTPGLLKALTGGRGE